VHQLKYGEGEGEEEVEERRKMEREEEKETSHSSILFYIRRCSAPARFSPIFFPMKRNKINKKKCRQQDLATCTRKETENIYSWQVCPLQCGLQQSQGGQVLLTSAGRVGKCRHTYY